MISAASPMTKGRGTQRQITRKREHGEYSRGRAETASSAQLRIVSVMVVFASPQLCRADHADHGAPMKSPAPATLVLKTCRPGPSPWIHPMAIAPDDEEQ